METDLVSEFFPELISVAPGRHSLRELAESRDASDSRGMGVVLLAQGFLSDKSTSMFTDVLSLFIHNLGECVCRIRTNLRTGRDRREGSSTKHFIGLSWLWGQQLTPSSPLVLQSGKFSSSSPAPASQPQGLSYAEDAAEHENMKAVLNTSSPAMDDATPVLGVRTRSRMSRGNSGLGGAHLPRKPPRGGLVPITRYRFLCLGCGCKGQSTPQC